MDSRLQPQRGQRSNEAISFQVICQTQEEVDDCGETLRVVMKPRSSAVGSRIDHGVSWQIIPNILTKTAQ